LYGKIFKNSWRSTARLENFTFIRPTIFNICIFTLMLNEISTESSIFFININLLRDYSKMMSTFVKSYFWPFLLQKIVIMKEKSRSFLRLYKDMDHPSPQYSSHHIQTNPLKKKFNWKEKKQFNVYLWGYLIINKFFHLHFFLAPPSSVSMKKKLLKSNLALLLLDFSFYSLSRFVFFLSSANKLKMWMRKEWIYEFYFYFV